MASLRKAKKQAKKEGKLFIDPKKANKYTEQDLLKKSLKVQVDATNKRLKELDKKGYYNSFSSKRLFNRLGGKIGALQKSGKKITGIKVKNNMNMTDLTAVLKATKNFLSSATSSPTKLKKVIRDTKKSMFKTLKLKDDTLTMADIETFYDMLGDSDFDYFNEKTGGSPVWAVVKESIAKGDSESEFLSKLNTLISLNDKDVKQRAVNLFKKYVA